MSDGGWLAGLEPREKKWDRGTYLEAKILCFKALKLEWPQNLHAGRCRSIPSAQNSRKGKIILGITNTNSALEYML
jgi:hypothetical protein